MTTINDPNISNPPFPASKSLEAFLPPKVEGLFLFLKGVAHRRCALSMAAMQQGELVFIDAVLTG